MAVSSLNAVIAVTDRPATLDSSRDRAGSHWPGDLVRLDRGERLGVLAVVVENVILDLVGVQEPQLAVRALVRVELIEHDSSTRPPVACR
jgi:hypothetical protein